MSKTLNKMEILAQSQERKTQHKGLVKRPLKELILKTLIITHSRNIRVKSDKSTKISEH